LALFACKTLQVDIELNGVVDITLQREAQHNALNAEMIRELTETLTTLQEDESIRMVCLQGAGKNFCAGADLNWMQQTINSEAKENLNDAVKLSELLSVLYHFSKPTLVVAHGAVYGGGIGLVACCDIAIGGPATFCLAETKLGLVPATISPYVVSAIGARAFNYRTLTGNTFTEKEAKNIGLLHEVNENPVQLANTKKEIINHILNNGPKALIAAKQLAKRLSTQLMDKELQQELAELIASLRVGEEAQTRMIKFLKK